MLRQSLIAATLVAVLPALAFAAPVTTAARPAHVMTVKAQKTAAIKKPVTVHKMKAAVHLKRTIKPLKKA